MTADIATTLASWSSTAASNQPDNSDSVGPNALAENLRTIQAVVRDAVAGNGTIASATTTDLSTVNDNYIAVTGTTTITGLGTVSAGIVKFLKFAGVLTFTHNGTSLILPGAANITTAAGDVAVMRSEGSGNWRCLAYQRSSGIAATLGSNNFTGAQNTSRATVASAATTADIWAASGNEIDWTGTTTCTGFPSAPQAGAVRTLICAAAAPFTAGANMLIDGTTSGNTITLAANDIVTVHAITTTQFRIEIKKYDGRPVVSSDGLFYKADPSTVAFTKTGAGAAEIKAGTKVDVSGTLVEFSAATAITMPTLTAGTDYAIWVKTDETIQADASFTSAPGAGTWRKIGGFHYAPGGNATGTSGGDTTPAINAYSFWDVKFRPACPDPRGMALVADSFWADIYLLGVDHLTNGTSKYNVSIADGSAPPKIPTKFGGTGSNAYSTLNWWEANEVLQSWGKRSPTYDEFAALAYGTTEATSSGGSDVPTTGVSGTGATNAWNKFTSRWGVIQATGCMWAWGANFGGGAAGASWTANTGGRGSTYQMENAALFGGAWGNTSYSGSRASIWSNSPPVSSSDIGVRGVCDHLILE